MSLMLSKDKMKRESVWLGVRGAHSMIEKRAMIWKSVRQKELTHTRSRILVWYTGSLLG